MVGAAGQCVEVGLSGPTWAEGLGGRLEIGRGGPKNFISLGIRHGNARFHTSSPKTAMFSQAPPAESAAHTSSPNTEIFKASTLKRNVNSCSLRVLCVTALGVTSNAPVFKACCVSNL